MFLLIIIAAGLVVATQVTESIYYGIAAVALALASLMLLAGRAWTDRLARRRETTAAQADGDEIADAVAVEADSPETARSQPEDRDRPGADVPAAAESPTAIGQDEVADEDSASRELQEVTDDEGALPAVVSDVAVEVVCVVPGRKRFHEPDCSSLAGRQSDELTREEAEEEGFTPCSLCCAKVRAIRRIV